MKNKNTHMNICEEYMILLNDTPITPTLFPDHTTQVWKLPEELLNLQFIDITWKFENEGEFLHLAQLKDLLESKNIRSELYLPYLPYGRQDKEVSNSSTFALRTFAKLLNSLNFNKIKILDPHSSKAFEFIDHVVEVYPVKQLHKIVEEIKPGVLCYPDKGALEKYDKISSYKMYRYIYGEKVRDQLTGNITSYKVIGDYKDKTVLIIDDICDGGMTFILLAKELLNQGIKEVNLFVTHGLFTKGLKVLKEAGIKRVFTPDGEVSETPNGFTYRRIHENLK